MAEAESNIVLESHETWRNVEGCAEYEVSNLGRVRNARTFQVLSDQPHKDGYRTVQLWRRRKRRSVLIHKLVADAFIGPRPDGQEVNHKDSNRANNVDTNLEYRTHIGNMIHARVEGFWSTPKLDEISVVLILELFALGYTSVQIANLIGMDPTSIRDIRNGNTWTYVTRAAG